MVRCADADHPVLSCPVLGLSWLPWLPTQVAGGLVLASLRPAVGFSPPSQWSRPDSGVHKGCTWRWGPESPAIPLASPTVRLLESSL